MRKRCNQLFASLKRLTKTCKCTKFRERISKEEVLCLIEKVFGDDEEISITEQISICSNTYYRDKNDTDASFDVAPVIKFETHSGDSNDDIEKPPETLSINYRESLALQRQDSWALMDLSMHSNDNSKRLYTHSPFATSQVLENRTSPSFESNIRYNDYIDTEPPIEADEENNKFASRISHSKNDLKNKANSNNDEGEVTKDEFDIWLEEMEKFASTLKSRGCSSNEVVKLCRTAHRGEKTIPRLPRTIITTRKSPTQNINKYCRAA